jgi:hypothetical protein
MSDATNNDSFISSLQNDSQDVRIKGEENYQHAEEKAYIHS